MAQAGSHPVTLTIPNKVAYSIHNYLKSIGGQAFDSGPQRVQQMNHDCGYRVTRNIAPVWIGEMGGSLDGMADSAGAGAGLADLHRHAAGHQHLLVEPGL